MNDRIERAREIKTLVAENIAKLRKVGYDPQTLTALIAREARFGQSALDALKTEHRADEQARAQVANRAIYGADDLRGTADPTAHGQSYRDAQARAAAIGSSTDALKTLRRAERSGDALLARAVAARGFESGWSEVSSAYSETNPGWKEAIGNTADTRLSIGLGAAIAFGLKPVPELKHVYDLPGFVKQNAPLYDRIDAAPKPEVQYAGGHFTEIDPTPIGAAQ